jgi:DNA-directed RNA polymerase specialized sigma24 family protein
MLVMHYTQGLRAKEIGVALKQTATAIHKALSRIREALRTCMEEPAPKPAR